MNLLYKDIREEESYKRGALKYGNGGVETRASKQGRRNRGVETGASKYFFSSKSPWPLI